MQGDVLRTSPRLTQRKEEGRHSVLIFHTHLGFQEVWTSWLWAAFLLSDPEAFARPELEKQVGTLV